MKSRLSELDALRGIAALSVVFFHFTIGRPHANYGFKYGVTGVDLFFIISGFVITLTLSKVASWKEFTINRIARLYPCYWTSVTFLTLLILAANFLGLNTARAPEAVVSPTLIQYAGNMTMVQYYLGIKNIDGPYWTLIIELIFYVFMVIVFVLNLLKNMELIGTCILAFTVFDLTVIQHYWPQVFTGIKTVFPLINHFPLFFSGILFYNIFMGRADIKKYLLLACCFGLQIALFNHGGTAHIFIKLPGYIAMLVLYYLIFFLFVNKKLGFIAVKPLLFLGTISYALYLGHDYAGRLIIIPTLLKIPHIYFVRSLIITVPLVIALAAFVSYKIEIPVRNYLKSRLEQWWLGKQPKTV